MPADLFALCNAREPAPSAYPAPTRPTTLTVSVESTYDQEDGVWDVVASAVDADPSYRGFGRHEHHVDAQAMALRELADRIDGTPRKGGE